MEKIRGCKVASRTTHLLTVQKNRRSVWYGMVKKMMCFLRLNAFCLGEDLRFHGCFSAHSALLVLFKRVKFARFRFFPTYIVYRRYTKLFLSRRKIKAESGGRLQSVPFLRIITYPAAAAVSLTNESGGGGGGGCCSVAHLILSHPIPLSPALPIK